VPLVRFLALLRHLTLPSDMTVNDLSTPALLVDRARLARNLDRMQARADANDVALRPHAKTHKSVALAREQQARGAEGLTVATVREAETFVDAGMEDVRVAVPVTGRDKHERLRVLRDEAAISFVVDTVAGAEQAAAVYDSSNPVEVLMEVDVGHGRCGVPWNHDETAVHLARRITDLPELRLVGILTHAGQAYDGPTGNETTVGALQRVARHERDRMLRMAARLAHDDVPGVSPDTFEVSIGSTPSLAAFDNATREGFRVTEIRPGNYVMHDAMQVGLGAAPLDDCALTVLTTVVSTQRTTDGPVRTFVDAGKKIFTTDTGYGTDGYGVVLSNAATMTPQSGVHLDHLSEEHGWLTVPSSAPLSVGDRLRIVPNHACVTVANQETLYIVEDENVVEAWTVAPRSW
jgi:D-serine deaminase-like pyridoxal phosphate-dependent protein